MSSEVFTNVLTVTLYFVISHECQNKVCKQTPFNLVLYTQYKSSKWPRKLILNYLGHKNVVIQLQVWPTLVFIYFLKPADPLSLLFTTTRKTSKNIIYNSITFIHCHLFVLYLHFIAGLKYIYFRDYLQLQCLSYGA